MFLQEIGSRFVARPTRTDLGFDFLVGFPNRRGGVNFTVVEVKATGQSIRGKYKISTTQLARWMNSNLPTLVLIVDVKNNDIYWAWPAAPSTPRTADHTMVVVPVIKDDVTSRESLRNVLAS
jgi:hypothetical protein